MKSSFLSTESSSSVQCLEDRHIPLIMLNKRQSRGPDLFNAISMSLSLTNKINLLRKIIESPFQKHSNITIRLVVRFFFVVRILFIQEKGNAVNEITQIFGIEKVKNDFP